MKQAPRFIGFCILTCLLLIRGTATAQSEDISDKTLAPYFFIPGGDEDVDRLPLKSTHAAVAIAGVIADVKVTQVYRNTTYPRAQRDVGKLFYRRQHFFQVDFPLGHGAMGDLAIMVMKMDTPEPGKIPVQQFLPIRFIIGHALAPQ